MEAHWKFCEYVLKHFGIPLYFGSVFQEFLIFILSWTLLSLKKKSWNVASLIKEGKNEHKL